MSSSSSSSSSTLQEFLRLADATSPIADKIRGSIDVIQTAIKRYGVEKLALSFNGGKDCTVLLDLLSHIPGVLPDLKVFYFNNTSSNALTNSGRGKDDEGDTFPELRAFIKSSVQHYGIKNFHEIHEPSIKTGLDRVHSMYPDVEAIFLGVRATDPFCARLGHFQSTDKGWAPLVRVSPILQWSYGAVWAYLRSLNVPYCSLYDAGYTSLGKRSETIPNPLLAKAPGAYHPAYMLKDESAERRGRNVVIKTDSI